MVTKEAVNWQKQKLVINKVQTIFNRASIPVKMFFNHLTGISLPLNQ
jgi:hypothetical protein